MWQEWLARWPRPADLAAASSGDAVRAWGRLGYPRRALRLHSAASQITQQHGGRVPSSYLDLRALDGVGEYTAAAVASFAFGERHPVIDTNVRRVFARSVHGSAQAAPSLTAVERQLAELLLPDSAEVAARWAVAVMELGALICTARSPKCDLCPIFEACAWQQAGAPASSLPARRGQSWHGTDRQVRGKILAQLRATTTALSADFLAETIPDQELRDPQQRSRCLASLIEDGLVEPVPAGYQLPG